MHCHALRMFWWLVVLNWSTRPAWRAATSRAMGTGESHATSPAGCGWGIHWGAFRVEWPEAHSLRLTARSLENWVTSGAAGAGDGHPLVWNVCCLGIFLPSLLCEDCVAIRKIFVEHASRFQRKYHHIYTTYRYVMMCLTFVQICVPYKHVHRISS